MARWIEADALKEKINTAFWSEIGKIIDNAPTIDAVEVVRCKECKYYETDECPMVYYSPVEDDVYDMRWWNKADDYCSWGERSE